MNGNTMEFIVFARNEVAFTRRHIMQLLRFLLERIHSLSNMRVFVCVHVYEIVMF